MKLYDLLTLATTQLTAEREARERAEEDRDEAQRDRRNLMDSSVTFATMVGQQKEIGSLRARVQELEEDKRRLDFLDSNLKFNMGWSVGKAPIGNINVTSVLFCGGTPKSIRDAIDAATSDQSQPGPDPQSSGSD